MVSPNTLNKTKNLKQTGYIKRKVNLQVKLGPNRNACKVYDFEKNWPTEILRYPNTKLLQSRLKELGRN